MEQILETYMDGPICNTGEDGAVLGRKCAKGEPESHIIHD